MFVKLSFYKIEKYINAIIAEISPIYKGWKLSNFSECIGSALLVIPKVRSFLKEIFGIIFS